MLYHCPFCNQKYDIERSMLNTSVECSVCGKSFVVKEKQPEIFTTTCTGKGYFILLVLSVLSLLDVVFRLFTQNYWIAVASAILAIIFFVSALLLKSNIIVTENYVKICKKRSILIIRKSKIVSCEIRNPRTIIFYTSDGKFHLFTRVKNASELFKRLLPEE
ncbi:MAG: hypothetical protein IJW08_03845 [Lentisphaeria bacterium]|nr:hypothetical protein [Lentisphaeria bacterium]